MVRNVSVWKRLKKPLLFCGYLGTLAAAAYSTFGHLSFFEVEEHDAREYERQEQNRQDVVQRHQKSLAELEERKATP